MDNLSGRVINIDSRLREKGGEVSRQALPGLRRTPAAPFAGHLLFSGRLDSRGGPVAVTLTAWRGPRRTDPRVSPCLEHKACAAGNSATDPGPPHGIAANPACRQQSLDRRRPVRPRGRVSQGHTPALRLRLVAQACTRRWFSAPPSLREQVLCLT